MKIEEIKFRFCTKEMIDKSSISFFSALIKESYLLVELGVRMVEDVKLSHNETSLILENPTGFLMFTMRYRFNIELVTGENKGYYDYIVNLDGKPVDEFIVFT